MFQGNCKTWGEVGRKEKDGMKVWRKGEWYEEQDRYRLAATERRK